MTTEDIYIESGYQIPQDKHDECAKRFDYWDMIGFADFVTEKRVKNDVVLDGGINCDHDYRRPPNSNNPFKCINCGKLRGQ